MFIVIRKMIYPMRGIATTALLLLFTNYLFGQTVPAPVPCTNPPNGPGCTCSTAGILCTPDLLDGFTYSMSTSVNFGDLPSGFGGDLCPGLPPDGVPNNVNFFAFIAWCTDLEMDVYITNCSEGTDSGNSSYGVQLGLFAGCGSQSSGWNPLACITDGFAVCENDPANITSPLNFNVTGLTIGNLYYFMMDGCAGSACDITVDVIGVCGTGMIDPWTTGLEGPLETCVGNTETYTAEDLDGAVQFYYYLDGVLIANGDELTSTDITWTTPGTFELCVDVANLPCITESDDPLQNCITIEVCEEADAGMIDVSPQPACPGEIVTVTVTGNTVSTGMDQYVIITDASGTIIEVLSGTPVTFTEDECITYTVYSYNVKTGGPVPMVGMSFPTDFPCDDNCCDIEDVPMVFEDTEAPVFVNPPGDETYTCYLDVPPMADLDWTDNCISGPPVVGTENTNNIVVCDGGLFTREWMVTDSCGNTGSHTQRITISPVPLATFINPPGDITIDCDAIPTSAPDLTADNGETGACGFNEVVSPTTTGMADLCGGALVNEWMTVDDCGRDVMHTQTITVNPVPEAMLINPPGDITVDCDAIPTSAPDLLYDNGESGACAIAGSIMPVMNGSADICAGGSFQFEWNDIDVCMRPITHTQTITVNPVPEAMYINPPQDMTVTCDNIPAPAANLDYTNGESGMCLIMDNVVPMIVDNTNECGGTIVNTWQALDGCMRQVLHVQTITVTPAPQGMYVNPPPANITVDCADIPMTAPDLTLTNGESSPCDIDDVVTPTMIGAPNPCGGSFQFEWRHVDNCNRTTLFVQTINVNAASAPVFEPTPPDLTVDCANIPASGPSLTYTNGETGICNISGTRPAIRTGTVSECSGLLVDTWQFVDACGNSITASRTITVNPSPEAMWTSTPQDITVSCADVPNIDLSLSYSNGESAPCIIEGEIDAIPSGTYDGCGGMILHTYTFTDNCGRTINESRTVTVEPAAEPVFIDPPDDLTLDCDLSYTPPNSLLVTNGETGPCEISDMAFVTTTWNANIMINEWVYTNPCTGITITHIQEVVTTTSPDILIDPTFGEICLDDFFDLESIFITDILGTNPTITFHNSSPPSPGNEINPLVQPFGTSIYYIYAENEFGCSDLEEFFIYVTEIVPAGDDVTVELCKDGNTLDLDSYLTSDASVFGFWFDVDGNGIDVSNPNAVNINNVVPGQYLLYYITDNSAECPADTAILTLNIGDGVVYEIADVSCSMDDLTYSVTITSTGNTIIASSGTVNVVDATTMEVTNIPIANAVTLTITDDATGCTTERIINPPNCDCPDVDPPTGTPNYKVCPADIPLTMTVVVPAGFTANWYDSQSSTTALASGTLTFDHTNVAAGLYYYYVESEEIATGCVSQERLQIEVEVVTLPQVIATEAQVCDDDADGLAAFDLNMIGSDVSPNPNNSVAFYLNQMDADLGVNALTSPYANTSNGQVIIAVSTNPTGCTDRVDVTLTVLAKPQFTLTTQEETCIGDQDGSIVINIVSSNGDVTTQLNNASFENALVYDSLNAGQYYITAVDTFGCTAIDSTEVEEGLLLTVDEFASECDNKGTLSDAADDVYILTFNISNNNGGTGTFDLYVDAGVAGTYSYGVQATYELPSDGSVKTVAFVDNNSGCRVERTIGPLNPCSTTCIITIDEIEAVCNDGGTDNNPGDDYYEVTINVSSINGAANNMYTILVDGAIRGAGTYGVPNTFNVVTSTIDVVITVQDSEDNQCQATATLSDLDPCSDGCAVLFSILSYECDNNGTILDKDDDTYTITITAQSINTGSNTYDLLVDALINGTYNYGDTVDIVLGADGLVHLLEAIDSDRPECMTSQMTQQLINCSTDCSIEVVIDNVTCDNAGTNDDDDDDTYTFDMTVTGGKGNGWSESGLGISGQYGVTRNYGPYLISSNELSLTIVDDDIAECTLQETIAPPASCSGCVQAMTVQANGKIDCNNPTAQVEATVSEPGDYTWTFNGGLVSNELTGEANAEGMYVFTVVFADGCSLLDSVLVESEGDINTADGGPDQELNCIVDTVYLDGSLSSTGAGLTYEWTDENGTVLSNELILAVTEEGNYFFQVLDPVNGCDSGKDLVNVTMDTSVPSTAIYANPGDQFDCIIAEIILTTDQEIGVAYTWITPEITFNNVDSISVNQIGEYILIATNSTTGCFDTGRIEILSFQEYPWIELSVDDVLDCDNAEVFISSEGSQMSDLITYSWYGPDGTLISNEENGLNVQEAGEYTLVLEDAENGCINSDSINVESIETDVGVEIEPTIEVIIGETVVLRPTVNIPLSEIVSISWDPSDGLSCTDCLEPTLLVEESNTYTVTIVDVNGCEGSATITIRAQIKTVITVPNVINSDSENGNDKFIIFTDDELAIIDQVLIYDRWGNKIFSGSNLQPNSPNGAWDGKFNGEPVNPGVFVYLIKARLSTGEQVRLSGDVTVIR